MTVLVAGVGNLFFRDDAFGVEVARRLALAPPAGARVVDFGIRALHLAYELLQTPRRLIVIDCMPRGGAPGTLYVLEPAMSGEAAAVPDAHGMSLPLVFATVRELGGRLPPTMIVGCEPADVEAGIGLSPAVAAAITGAAELVRELITCHQEPP